MDVVAFFVKKTIPKYLQSLPIPEKLADVEKLTGQQWLQLIVFVLGVIIVVMSILKTCLPSRPRRCRVNESIQLDQDKVAHFQDIEDLGDKTAFCRCWKSKKFPYCDGSHNKHNETIGDNLGPVVIKRKESSEKAKK